MNGQREVRSVVFDDDAGSVSKVPSDVNSKIFVAYFRGSVCYYSRMSYPKRLSILVAAALSGLLSLKAITLLFVYLLPAHSPYILGISLLLFTAFFTGCIPFAILRFFNVPRAMFIASFANFCAVIMYIIPVLATWIMYILGVLIFITAFMVFDAIFNQLAIRLRYKVIISVVIIGTIYLLWQSAVTLLLS